VVTIATPAVPPIATDYTPERTEPMMGAAIMPVDCAYANKPAATGPVAERPIAGAISGMATAERPPTKTAPPRVHAPIIAISLKVVDFFCSDPACCASAARLSLIFSC